MANRQKYTRGSLAHLLAHLERKKDKEGNYYKFGNEDIDPSKSNLNYNLAAEDQLLPQLDFIHKRMKECECLNRKDVNVVMSWCITLPVEMNEKSAEEQLKFFEACYEFLKKRYGKENVISAWVHNDESGQPHLHFAYVPVMYDKTKEKYKFNAKKVGSLTDLNTFHGDIDKHLTKAMGYETGVITGETEVNLTIKQLKELRKREKELLKQIEKSKKEVTPVPAKRLGMIKAGDVEAIVEQNKMLTEALEIEKEKNRLLERQNKLFTSKKLYKRVKALESLVAALQEDFERLRSIINGFVDFYRLRDRFEDFLELIEREEKDLDDRIADADDYGLSFIEWKNANYQDWYLKSEDEEQKLFNQYLEYLKDNNFDYDELNNPFSLDLDEYEIE